MPILRLSSGPVSSKRTAVNGAPQMPLRWWAVSMMVSFMVASLRMAVMHATHGELAFEIVVHCVKCRVATGVVHGVDQRDKLEVGRCFIVVVKHSLSPFS